MDGWRLDSAASELLQVFVGSIEGSWRSLISDLEPHPTKQVSLSLLPIFEILVNEDTAWTLQVQYPSKNPSLKRHPAASGSRAVLAS